MPKYRIARHSVTQPSNKSYRLIPLTQGQNAIVDAADYDWLMEWNWHAHWDKCTKSFYAFRAGRPRLIAMHREILGCIGEEQGDHRNHNTLDNRRANLRKVLHAQNAKNYRKQANRSSRFKGVTWNKESSAWMVRICVNRKSIYLGRFHGERQAALIYDEAAKRYHGEFAHLNFPN